MAAEVSIRTLVEKAARADREAFDELIRRLRPRLAGSIRAWARLRLGPPLDVDEVMQDTFVRAHGSLERFTWDGDDSFFRWLCGIAKRVVAQAAIDVRKAQAGGTLSSASNVPAQGLSASRTAMREERLQRLERALAEVKPEHREVMLLARVEGLSIKEIAVRTGRPLATVKYHLACGLAALKRRFGDTKSLRLPARELRVDVDKSGE